MTDQILPRKALYFVESYATEISVLPDGYLHIEQYNPNIHAEVGGAITQIVSLSREQFRYLLANADFLLEQLNFGGNE